MPVVIVAASEGPYGKMQYVVITAKQARTIWKHLTWLPFGQRWYSEDLNQLLALPGAFRL